MVLIGVTFIYIVIYYLFNCDGTFYMNNLMFFCFFCLLSVYSLPVCGKSKKDVTTFDFFVCLFTCNKYTFSLPVQLITWYGSAVMKVAGLTVFLYCFIKWS